MGFWDEMVRESAKLGYSSDSSGGCSNTLYFGRVTTRI
jgi:hypothetical protein